ncbi:putative metalloprotease CJM1_0395 family protein [Aestuariibacter sp. A3R04]|uniref:putative metalloprotease CJM1_0395 family protein n=1 Tax=Aestuariibacter sp. A3R04 TaxID=2841571 RepID=UPI001C086546|nr:putative metalloprotease CJM1_0395 family protein [Aestuariibacter sp. A3R04]MBU3020323.1 hypothetical protein [Aestuariibacter sp. A3R04]
MNIVTPVPTSLVFTTANVSTEAARRENLLKDTIPPSKEAEQGTSEQGLGSESDRAKSPGQKPAPVTYERPQVQVDSRPDVLQNESNEAQSSDTDNGDKESAGKGSAEEKQQQQAQQKEIESLEARDQEVRQHEQAHAAAGGQYAGSPQYEYDTGPDGKRYVTDGEVSIDVSEADSPEQTVRKMEQVRAAALAPAEPSAQDLKVAGEASRKAAEARAELSSNEGGIGEASQATVDDAFSVEGTGARQLEIQDEVYQNRIGVIQQFYQDQVSPKVGGFSVSA